MRLLRRFKTYSGIKKFYIILPWIVIFFTIPLVFANLAIVSNAEGKTFDSVTSIPSNRTGLLPGTSKIGRSGGENQYYRFRINATAQLLKSGKIQRVLISGDRTGDYNEPDDMKTDLIKLGIPADKILLDYTGFSTIESMRHAKKYDSHITVISQKFHNERAIYLGETIGLKVIGYNAKNETAYRGFLTALRERFARVKLFIDIWTD